MILRNLPDRVAILRQPDGADEYGDPLPVGAFELVGVARGWLQQITAVEKVESNRSPAESSWRLYLRADADLRIRDRVRIADRTFDVHGEPYTVHRPEGPSHVQATLTYVEG